MKIEVKHKYFKEVVQKVKELGFQVWIPENLYQDNFRYAYVTDGTGILYFQIDDLYGLQWSTECVPSHETGSGVRVHLPHDLTEEDIQRAFKTPHGVPYPNFQSFRDRKSIWYNLIQI